MSIVDKWIFPKSHRRLSKIFIVFRHHSHYHRHFHHDNGEDMSFTVGPVSLVDGSSITAAIQGYDQYGQPFALPAGTTVAYSIDSPSIATSTPNSDGLTDAIQAVGVGVANLTASVTVPGSTTPLTDTEAITVTQAPPVLSSVKIEFGSGS
jgi:hypothetical protein